MSITRLAGLLLALTVSGLVLMHFSQERMEPLTDTVTTPVWPDKFAQTFNEVEVFGKVIVTKTSGKMFYDWPNRRYKVFRQKGEGDRYCGPVEGRKNSTCVHLVVGGRRYLVFRQIQKCCYCCNDTSGCGLLKPDWLATAKPNGSDVINGQTFRKWEVDGLQKNYYWQTSDSQRIMKRLNQGTDDLMDFDLASFTTEIDPKEFQLPSYCNTNCPSDSTCGFVREGKQLWGGH